MGILYSIAEKYYDKSTLQHAERVMKHALSSPIVKDWDVQSLGALSQAALFHDIIEDTDFTFEEMNELVNNLDMSQEAFDAVCLLTKDKWQKYDWYCFSIRDSGDKIAYVVKLADIKDHLSLKDTLTDRLKEKYIDGLANLL